MNRKLFGLFSVIMVLSMLLASCAPAAATQAPAAGGNTAATSAPAAKKIKVVNLINGVQGDKSFFDSAVRGMTKASKDFNIDVKTIEAGVDPAKWQPALEDAAANEDYDVMVLGTYQMSEFLQQVAPKYPDKKFIIYDVAVDPTKCANKCDNVYSITYKQNEGSYLAGLYAALMSKTKSIGAVGGQDIPVINDFIVGYKQGAKDGGVDPSKVIVQYAGGWNDPAKGKEIALAEYQQGADIVFNIAGGTGVGIFQAAQEAKKNAIGVDSDQATIIKDTDPEQAKVILTSMMKNVDNSLYRAMQMYKDGKIPWGKAEALGVGEGGVGLAKNDIFSAATSAEVKAKIEQAEKDLEAGKIQVDTVFK
jgi:basic membrane protein A and related proteins